MPKFTKTQIIILVVVLVVILGGIIGWAVSQKSKLLPKEEATPEEVATEEVFSLSGIVSKVNVRENFLMVKPVGDPENEVKVVISEETKLFKLEYPSETGNPSFALKRVEITIEDFKEGDRVFIKTNISIAGKKELDGVDYIEILP